MSRRTLEMGSYFSIKHLLSVSILLFYSGVPINVQSKSAPKYVIFDTDMGADDAWALQLLLKAERDLKIVKVLAITTADGNTDITNVIRNTYRILDGLNRTDVRHLNH